jgi:hypothetical protein
VSELSLAGPVNRLQQALGQPAAPR